MDPGAVISLEEACCLVDEALASVRLPVETVPTLSAAGRVLAREHTARVDLPPFNKAAVDGYAISGPAADNTYRVAQTVAAGQAGAPALRPGDAVKVMTGAPVPPGTVRVVMLEESEPCGQFVKLKERGQPNVCEQGEDMKRGAPVLPAGTFLRALEAGNLIGCGITSVDVYRRPRVAIISTGDEIVDDPALLAAGKIMNVNGPLLAGLCSANSMDVTSQVSVPDTSDAVSRALQAALTQADIVILSGGVSVGDFDFVLGALGGCGLRLHFSRLAVKPGKPTAFAARTGNVVFGLPGNPVSVFLMFHLFVLRAVARLTGGPVRLRHFSVPLKDAFRRRHAERAEYVPARLMAEGAAAVIGYHGSAHLLALTNADGFAVIPFGVQELPAGARVEFVLLPGLQ
jgi:molybdopterin molybdotransferase